MQAVGQNWPALGLYAAQLMNLKKKKLDVQEMFCFVKLYLIKF